MKCKLCILSADVEYVEAQAINEKVSKFVRIKRELFPSNIGISKGDVYDAEYTQRYLSLGSKLSETFHEINFTASTELKGKMIVVGTTRADAVGKFKELESEYVMKHAQLEQTSAKIEV